ncbi:MAG: hypothetical protein IJC12_03305 [Peptococcaceae bacterium]|nr:hypothetical protein [Peptococcaceae bacterium]
MENYLSFSNPESILIIEKYLRNYIELPTDEIENEIMTDFVGNSGFTQSTNVLIETIIEKVISRLEDTPYSINGAFKEYSSVATEAELLYGNLSEDGIDLPWRISFTQEDIVMYIFDFAEAYLQQSEDSVSLSELTKRVGYLGYNSLKKAKELTKQLCASSNSLNQSEKYSLYYSEEEKNSKYYILNNTSFQSTIKNLKDKGNSPQVQHLLDFFEEGLEDGQYHVKSTGANIIYAVSGLRVKTLKTFQNENYKTQSEMVKDIRRGLEAQLADFNADNHVHISCANSTRAKNKKGVVLNPDKSDEILLRYRMERLFNSKFRYEFLQGHIEELFLNQEVLDADFFKEYMLACYNLPNSYTKQILCEVLFETLVGTISNKIEFLTLWFNMITKFLNKQLPHSFEIHLSAVFVIMYRTVQKAYNIAGYDETIIQLYHLLSDYIGGKEEYKCDFLWDDKVVSQKNYKLFEQALKAMKEAPEDYVYNFNCHRLLQFFGVTIVTDATCPQGQWNDIKSVAEVINGVANKNRVITKKSRKFIDCINRMLEIKCD